MKKSTLLLASILLAFIAGRSCLLLPATAASRSSIPATSMATWCARERAQRQLRPSEGGLASLYTKIQSIRGAAARSKIPRS